MSEINKGVVKYRNQGFVKDDVMDKIEIYEEQLQALLDAAVRTAMTHRGKQHEEYVLGQLEATANFIYVLCVGQDNSAELEEACQRYAQTAIERLTEIHPPNSHYGFDSEGSPAGF